MEIPVKHKNRRDMQCMIVMSQTFQCQWSVRQCFCKHHYKLQSTRKFSMQKEPIRSLNPCPKIFGDSKTATPFFPVPRSAVRIQLAKTQLIVSIVRLAASFPIRKAIFHRFLWDFPAGPGLRIAYDLQGGNLRGEGA